MISVLAVGLSLIQIGEKRAQNEYLTHHIAVSDDWAFYQAKNLRAVVRGSEATLLESMPNAPTAEMQARIRDARDYVARMRDDPAGGEGMKQLAVKAKEQEHARDEAFHRYHFFEYASGLVEIAIVLASVSVVTGVRALAVGAGAIGVGAGLFAIAVAAHVV